MHFCQQRTLHTYPQFTLNGAAIPIVNEFKFLGLIFDKTLKFIPHIKYLKDRCMKAMNLLKVVAHTDWGADGATLLKLYRSHVRSKLDYGCIVYGSARSSYLQALDRVQNGALRLCLGAFRTSPIPSLQVEANELPLTLRREKLTLQYITKLKSTPDNPAYTCVFEPKYTLLFEAKPFVIPTLGVRVKDLLSDTGIRFECIEKSSLSPVPPWLLKTPTFIYALHDIGTKSDLFKLNLNELLADFDSFQRIYTDGSKVGAAVAAAAMSGPTLLVNRLPNGSSIFSAEARGILLALSIMESSAHDEFLILTDSLSCLQSIQNRKLDHPLILEIVVTLHQLIASGKRVIFIWLPSHTGLAGNVSVDAAAKAALNLAESQTPVPFSDFYPLINTHITSHWQRLWNANTNNKLHSIEPKVNISKPYQLPRRDELIIHRLRIGHTHLTHGFLLKREDPPECIGCQTTSTVEHILLNCIEFQLIRVKYYTCTNLSELFNNVPARAIVDFIKEIGLYRKL